MPNEDEHYRIVCEKHGTVLRECEHTDVDKRDDIISCPGFPCGEPPERLTMSDEEWNLFAEAAGFDDKPRLSIVDTADLIKKLAEATFEEFREGGGHDMGLWLDSGEINEDQYRYLEALREA